LSQHIFHEGSRNLLKSRETSKGFLFQVGGKKKKMFQIIKKDSFLRGFSFLNELDDKMSTWKEKEKRNKKPSSN